LRLHLRLRRYVEIWNLVFMQFDRDASGKLNPLPRPRLIRVLGSNGSLRDAES